MRHRFGVSGSTILSDPARLEALFWDHIDCIEIGEFPDEAAFHAFLKLREEKGVPYGVHSPLLRSGSKYDLIRKWFMEPEEAWERLELEAKRLSSLGAQYILVHFPYFPEAVDGDTNGMIEQGLKRLKTLQLKYDIPFVCEPKLGLGRSSIGIDYLDRFPVELWANYAMGLCIDIGDYFIAAGERIHDYLGKWKRFIKVVHLHNVAFEQDKYIWIPVHPSHERNGIQYSIESVVRDLAECEEVTFIFEHTPHSNPSQAFVQDGYEWIRRLVSH